MGRFKTSRPKISMTDRLEISVLIYAKMSGKKKSVAYRDLLLLGLHLADSMSDDELNELLDRLRRVYL